MANIPPPICRHLFNLVPTVANPNSDNVYDEQRQHSTAPQNSAPQRFDPYDHDPFKYDREVKPKIAHRHRIFHYGRQEEPRNSYIGAGTQFELPAALTAVLKHRERMISGAAFEQGDQQTSIKAPFKQDVQMKPLVAACMQNQQPCLPPIAHEQDEQQTLLKAAGVQDDHSRTSPAFAQQGTDGATSLVATSEESEALNPPVVAPERDEGPMSLKAMLNENEAPTSPAIAPERDDEPKWLATTLETGEALTFMDFPRKHDVKSTSLAATLEESEVLTSSVSDWERSVETTSPTATLEESEAPSSLPNAPEQDSEPKSVVAATLNGSEVPTSPTAAPEGNRLPSSHFAACEQDNQLNPLKIAREQDASHPSQQDAFDKIKLSTSLAADPEQHKSPVMSAAARAGAVKRAAAKELRMRKATDEALQALPNFKRTFIPQSESCHSHLFADMPPCRACSDDGPDQDCSFADLRAFPIERDADKLMTFSADAAATYVLQPLNKKVELELPRQEDLNRPMDDRTRGEMMITCAVSLLPTLEEALQHFEQPGVLVRHQGTRVRASCDFCKTGLFAAFYMCRLCAQEYCCACQRTMRVADVDMSIDRTSSMLLECGRMPTSKSQERRYRTHNAADLVPFSSCARDSLESEVLAMRAAMEAPEQPPSPLPSQSSLPSGASSPITPLPDTPPMRVVGLSKIDDTNEKPPSHLLAEHSNDTFTEKEFLSTWQRGEPLLVSNIPVQPMWHPSALQRAHGRDRCEIVRCDDETGNQERKKTTVAAFFKTYGKPQKERLTMLGLKAGDWRLKDWPSSSEFKELYPTLSEDFDQVVPMPDYTRRDGCKNLSSLFAKNALKPDLGPKMYNAWPGQHTAGGKGTTRLHMDIADAVNILLYTEPIVDVGERAAAQWDIFRAEDANKIRDFLREYHAKSDDGDPIHGQLYYLDDDMLQELYRVKGVFSWRIYQREGQAIFIPAGCAHQVCNLTDCVKVAVDFLSPQNVQRCFQLTEEFRGLSTEHYRSWKEDVLELRTQLWYAWLSCRRMGLLAEKQTAKRATAKKSKRPSLTKKRGTTKKRKR